jgi:hypothetical protein
MIAAAATDKISVIPSVRAIVAVDTKNGTIVDTMYASMSSACSAALLVPG